MALWPIPINVSRLLQNPTTHAAPPVAPSVTPHLHGLQEVFITANEHHRQLPRAVAGHVCVLGHKAVQLLGSKYMPYATNKTLLWVLYKCTLKGFPRCNYSSGVHMDDSIHEGTKHTGLLLS